MGVEAVKNTKILLGLKGKDVGLIVGIPPEDETSAGAVDLTGDIDGTNLEFQFPDDHIIFNKSCVALSPQPGDITVWFKKGTNFVEAEVDSIELAANSLTGQHEYTKIKLKTAPSSTLADKVVGVCVRQLEPYIQQSLKVEPKQDSSVQKQLRSDITHTSYDALTVTISQDYLIGDFEPLLEFFFENYSGIEEVPEDAEVYQMTSVPKTIYASIPVEKKGEVIGFLNFPQVRATCSTLIDVSAGDDMKSSMDIAVDTVPLFVKEKAEA